MFRHEATKYLMPLYHIGMLCSVWCAGGENWKRLNLRSSSGGVTSESVTSPNNVNIGRVQPNTKRELNEQ
ncbi:hypothetical protein E2C01_031940 [Portunus trituberculatus]|uniref:Uncharacterized protein n=1 Tax=Portunus trituberculatus TaxID=210409 RepID=A0A5B7F004_PORTR|nr:hypothetical protein [Portunus trituberculatus]